MSALLIALVTFIYSGVAISYWLNDNKAMSLVFIGYAIANIGLIIAELKG